MMGKKDKSLEPGWRGQDKHLFQAFDESFGADFIWHLPQRKRLVASSLMEIQLVLTLG